MLPVKWEPTGSSYIHTFQEDSSPVFPKELTGKQQLAWRVQGSGIGSRNGGGGGYGEEPGLLNVDLGVKIMKDIKRRRWKIQNNPEIHGGGHRRELPGNYTYF